MAVEALAIQMELEEVGLVGEVRARMQHRRHELAEAGAEGAVGLDILLMRLDVGLDQEEDRATLWLRDGGSNPLEGLAAHHLEHCAEHLRIVAPHFDHHQTGVVEGLAVHVGGDAGERLVALYAWGDVVWSVSLITAIGTCDEGLEIWVSSQDHWLALKGVVEVHKE